MMMGGPVAYQFNSNRVVFGGDSEAGPIGGGMQGGSDYGSVGGGGNLRETVTGGIDLNPKIAAEKDDSMTEALNFSQPEELDSTRDLIRIEAGS